MTNTPEQFKVTEFNLNGFLKLTDENIKNGGELLFFQKNQIEIHTHWQIFIGTDLTTLEMNATYEPTSKLDFSKLATYKASQNFTFTDITNLKNEKDEIEKIFTLFYKKLSDGYNNRLEKTKVKVAFPIVDKQLLDHFQERAIVSLHKAIERLKNFQ